MTHQPLTKAEREELQAFSSDRMNVSEYSSSLIDRALADLDAAEALHNSVMADLAACVCRAEESDARVRDGEDVVRDVIAQRDRAESERDALKAKLAALVEAASEFYEATFTDLESCLTSEDIVLRGNLGDAIAAARGGAQ